MTAVPMIFPDDRPRVRSTDPPTSHVAADMTTRRGDAHHEVLSWLSLQPRRPDRRRDRREARTFPPSEGSEALLRFTPPHRPRRARRRRTRARRGRRSIGSRQPGPEMGTPHMTNVIPFPTVDDAPVMRRDTVSSLLASGPTPRHGDYVFTIRHVTDHGHIAVTAPGTGLVHSVDTDPATQSIAITYAGGLRVTASRDAVLVWYSTPQGDTQ